jgi:hypothetical protein
VTIWHVNYFWLSLMRSVPDLEIPFNLMSLTILCKITYPVVPYAVIICKTVSETTVSKYPTTFCGTFLHELIFSHLLQKFSAFVVQDCNWGTSWCRTHTLPKCTLILKCHVFFWDTHECNFFFVHKRNTVLLGANFHENYKYSTVFRAEFCTEFYPHLKLNAQIRHSN